MVGWGSGYPSRLSLWRHEFDSRTDRKIGKYTAIYFYGLTFFTNNENMRGSLVQVQPHPKGCKTIAFRYKLQFL